MKTRAFRLNEQEDSLLVEAAKAQGKTPSEYVRDLLKCPVSEQSAAAEKDGRQVLQALKKIEALDLSEIEKSLSRLEAHLANPASSDSVKSESPDLSKITNSVSGELPKITETLSRIEQKFLAGLGRVDLVDWTFFAEKLNSVEELLKAGKFGVAEPPKPKPALTPDEKNIAQAIHDIEIMHKVLVLAGHSHRAEVPPLRDRGETAEISVPQLLSDWKTTYGVFVRVCAGMMVFQGHLKALGVIKK